MNEQSTLTRRGRPQTRNKEYLLEVAMSAYWQADAAEVSLNAICMMAGVSKPSLYRDFGGEDGLTAAVLARYAQIILAPIESMLVSQIHFHAKLEHLIAFACQDSRLEVGCLFVKMRAKRSRLGEKTQAQIAVIESQALKNYTQFFQGSAASGEWGGRVSANLAAIYLHEQLGLAISQRPAAPDGASIRELLTLALSVLYT